MFTNSFADNMVHGQWAGFVPPVRQCGHCTINEQRGGANHGWTIMASQSWQANHGWPIIAGQTRLPSHGWQNIAGYFLYHGWAIISRPTKAGHQS